MLWAGSLELVCWCRFSAKRIAWGDKTDGTVGDTENQCFRIVDDFTNQSTLLEKIKEAQSGDSKIQKFRNQVEARLRTDIQIHGDRTLHFGDRICVPKGDVRQEVLSESHNSAYSIHPRGTKMYQDLKQRFWWHRMKREIARYIAKCLVCQQVKAEHQRMAGLL